jgi:hypothetical protein
MVFRLLVLLNLSAHYNYNEKPKVAFLLIDVNFERAVVLNMYRETLYKYSKSNGEDALSTNSGDKNSAMKAKGGADFTIAKADDDKQYVFGWGQVALSADGEVVEDLQNDVVDPTDLEEAAYDHVLNFRNTGEQHDPALRSKGKLIESCVFTKEKQEAIGIPEGFVPIGWWVGYYIEDVSTWEKVKSGEYSMFSVEGTGEREEIGKGVLTVSFKNIYEKYREIH